jgi:hypothetical protein
LPFRRRTGRDPRCTRQRPLQPPISPFSGLDHGIPPKIRGIVPENSRFGLHSAGIDNFPAPKIRTAAELQQRIGKWQDWRLANETVKGEAPVSLWMHVQDSPSENGCSRRYLGAWGQRRLFPPPISRVSGPDHGIPPKNRGVVPGSARFDSPIGGNVRFSCPKNTDGSSVTVKNRKMVGLEAGERNSKRRGSGDHPARSPFSEYGSRCMSRGHRRSDLASEFYRDFSPENGGYTSLVFKVLITEGVTANE